MPMNKFFLTLIVLVLAAGGLYLYYQPAQEQYAPVSMDPVPPPPEVIAPPPPQAPGQPQQPQQPRPQGR